MKSVNTDEGEKISNILTILNDSGFHVSKDSLPQISMEDLRKASIIQTQKRIMESLTLDKNLIQVIEALDDAHTSLNLISERLCTWFAHTRGISRTKVDDIIEKTTLPDPMSRLGKTYIHLQELIKSLSKYIDLEAPKVFPSMVELLGTQLSVRLVSSAGSLAKLARLPSSTIQLLGAEKALFRHMSEGSPPPKHGILYQHPSVKLVNKKVRGKVSRSLASKVAIAAKIDYYREKDEG